MGKGRDKRRRKARKEKSPKITYTVARAKPSRSDPSIPDEPDAPVYAPLRPKPRRLAGAIAIPEPDPEDAFIVVQPRASK